MPAPISDSLSSAYAPFAVVVTLSAKRRAPGAIVVERGDQQWLAPAALDSMNSRPDSVTFYPKGNPPLWLDRTDSVDVCLMFGRARAPKIIRLGRIEVVQTA